MQSLPITRRSSPSAQHAVGELRANGEGEVRGQRPRRRRPGEHACSGAEQLRAVRDRLEVETHRHGRVGAVPVGVVLAGLEVRQRRLALPAVGQHPEAFVQEPLVVEALQGPQDALHVREVHRLVGVLEVDPARLARHVALPGVGRPLHELAAVGVEVVDAVGDHGLAARELELLFCRHLGREAVAVPAETALDAMAAHRLEAGDGVLDEAGQEMAVVGQPVREGRPVVEDVLGVLAVQVDRRLEGAVLAPEGEDLLLEGRVARLALDLRVATRAGRFGHGHTVGGCGRGPVRSRVDR